MNEIREMDGEVRLSARKIEVDAPIHIVSVETGCALRIKEISQGGINVIEDEYEGPYDVVPKKDSQVLKTKMKGMARDVTVEEIPYIEVSNESGTTVIIATE